MILKDAVCFPAIFLGIRGPTEPRHSLNRLRRLDGTMVSQARPAFGDVLVRERVVSVRRAIAASRVLYRNSQSRPNVVDVVSENASVITEQRSPDSCPFQNSSDAQSLADSQTQSALLKGDSAWRTCVPAAFRTIRGVTVQIVKMKSLRS